MFSIDSVKNSSSSNSSLSLLSASKKDESLLVSKSLSSDTDSYADPGAN